MHDNNIGHEIDAFDFPKLLIDTLGWDRHRGTWPVRVIEPGQRSLGPGLQYGHGSRDTSSAAFYGDLDQQTFHVQAIAQKKGVQIFQCSFAAGGTLPNYPTRCRIQHQVAQIARENVIIFTDKPKTQQIWQWVLRVTGEPPQYFEHQYLKGSFVSEQNRAVGEEQKENVSETLPDRLRHLTFSLADEEHLTLTEVILCLKRAFYFCRSKNRRGAYSRVRLYEYDVAEMDPSVQFWVEQVYAEPRLSRAEEFALARDVAEGNDKAWRKFIQANLYLVAEIAWRLAVDNNLAEDDFLDLIQRGNVLLVESVRKFDCGLGVRFQSFASLMISSELSAAVRMAKAVCHLPNYQVERLPQMQRLWPQIEDMQFQQLGRQPTDSEIGAEVAARMSLPPQLIAHLRSMMLSAEPWDVLQEEWENAMDRAALGDPWSQEEGHIPLFLDDPWLRLDAAVNLVRREQLEFVLNKLTVRERDVILMRFGLNNGKDYTLEEIGQRFAVTRERVRQIELRALKKLRRMGPMNIGEQFATAKSAVVADDPSVFSQTEESKGDPEFDESDCDSAI